MPLESKLKQLEKALNQMGEDFKEFRKEVRVEFSKIRRRHDRADGVEEYKRSHTTPSAFGIPREAWNVIRWLILIIAAILGVQVV